MCAPLLSLRLRFLYTEMLLASRCRDGSVARMIVQTFRNSRNAYVAMGAGVGRLRCWETDVEICAVGSWVLILVQCWLKGRRLSRMNLGGYRMRGKRRLVGFFELPREILYFAKSTPF